MKSEKGVTLTALVIYIIVATILIGAIAMLSSHFFSNIILIKDQDKYAIEFNKFSMYFIDDVKQNNSATVTTTKIVFEDGTMYQYDSSKQAIYRYEDEYDESGIQVTQQTEGCSFTLSEETVSNTTKQIINVKLTVDGTQNSSDGIEYVLKYW